MSSMGHDRRKPRLTGPALPVTQRWKDDVLAWCSKNKVSPAELGRQVGLSQSAMSRLLNGDQRTSRAAGAICDVTGVTLYEKAAGNGDDDLWLELGAKIRREKPEEYKRLRALLESLAKTK